MFQLIKPGTNFEIIGKRHIFAVISGLLVLGSILAVIFIGPTYGIDFRGGTDIILHFNEEVETDDVRDVAEDAGLPDVIVQHYGEPDENRFMVQTRAVSVVDEEISEEIEADFEGLGEMNEYIWTKDRPNSAELTYESAVDTAEIEQVLSDAGLEDFEVKDVTQRGINTYRIEFEELQTYVVDEFENQMADSFDTVDRMETVGAAVGEQFRNAGVLSIVVALIFILIYIAFRFDIRYAPGAVAALTHDVIISVGFFTVFGIEISLPIVAALLTIVGYSLNDTIVVFDRIRENLESAVDEPVDRIANRSINETLSRTIMTSMTTLVAVAAIAVIGGGLIQDFAIALIVGVIIGTYSSVYVASPVMLKMDSFLKARREANEILQTPDAGKDLVGH
ncbi:MAG: protein translocase subunit SecF [Persicimonas sp.]